MSLTLYDRAITEKFKHWILDDKMIVLPPDDTRAFFEWRADTSNDKPLTLPFISINRNRDATIRDTGKKPMSYQGKVFNSSQGVSDHLNAIPISLSYNINIYTRTLEEADEYMRNFVFNIINYPSIIIKIPYNNSPLAYTSYMKLQETISDNSDIPERLVHGQFSRITLGVELNDAYLFSYNKRNIPRITDVQISNIVVETSDTENNIQDVDNIKIII